jgi:hypothetical protein
MDLFHCVSAHLAKLNELDYTLVSFLLQYLPLFVPKIGVLGGLPPHTTPFTLKKYYIFSLAQKNNDY